MSPLLLRLLTATGIATLLIMVVATLVAVVTRFMGTTGFEWSYEVAGIAFIWTTFLGAGVAEANHEIAAFDLVRATAPLRWRSLFDKLSALVLLIAGAALLASGAAALNRSGWVPTPLLRWPSFVQMTAAPVLGTCLCGLAVRRLIRRNAAPGTQSSDAVPPHGIRTPL